MSVKVEATAPGAFRTRGLSALGYSDLSAAVKDPKLEPAVRELLETFAQYQVNAERVVRAGETIGHGYWITKAVPGSDAILDLWELGSDGEEFVPGVTLTARYWVEQQGVCERAKAAFAPPRPDQKTAVSAGVLEGRLPTRGVRYIAPTHMSGWYIYTEDFDGDVDTLQVHHLYHVTDRRPDVAKYIALPHGYRFTLLEDGDEIRFDPAVAAER